MKNNKENKPGGDGRKQLTPHQIRQRRKILVYPLFLLIFAGAMWLIFAPSKSEKEKRQGEGLNAELPDPGRGGIVGNKRDAYEQEQFRAKQEERLRSLSDFAALLGEAEKDPEAYERQVRLAPVPPDYHQEVNVGRKMSNGSGTSRDALQSSADAYRDINRQLGSFYDEPQADPEKGELQRRIEELERKLSDSEQAGGAAGEQLSLIEKSYELAARYMSPGQGNPTQQTPAASTEIRTPEKAGNGKAAVRPVNQARQSVASALTQPVNDSTFAAERPLPRNKEFHTAVGTERQSEKNTVAAVIHDSRTVTDGEDIRLRLLEPMAAADVILPRNALITGTGKIQGERLSIAVTSLEYGGTIMPVELTVYDTDGQPGIFIPGSMEVSAAKEIVANMGAGFGSSINITQQSAGEQLLTDLGRGALQGTSQYAARKMREVKVHLKAGYKVMLYQNKNQ